MLTYADVMLTYADVLLQVEVVEGAAACSKWMKDASVLLNKLNKNKKARPFLSPIDPIECGCLDYSEIIRPPRYACCLNDIQTKLAASEYVSAEGFLLDVLMTFDNAQV